jgi:hypothetical protein
VTCHHGHKEKGKETREEGGKEEEITAHLRLFQSSEYEGCRDATPLLYLQR